MKKKPINTGIDEKYYRNTGITNSAGMCYVKHILIMAHGTTGVCMLSILH